MTKTKIKYFYGLVMAFCLTLFMVTVSMGVTLCKENEFSALYDGSVTTTALTNAKTEEVTMTVQGFSSVKELKDVTVNEKTYKYATSSGGSSGSSKYIELVSTTPFKVAVVASCSGSNSSGYFVDVQTTKTYTQTDKPLLKLTTKDVYVYGCSEQLPAGTYYLTFNGTINVAEISVQVMANEDTTNSSTVEDSTNSTIIEDSTQNSEETSANTSANTSVNESTKNDNKTSANVFEKDKTLKVLLGAIGGVVLVFILFFIGCKIFEKRKW